MSRKNENVISELLGVILGSPDCRLSGWVAVARATNLNIKEDVATLLLARPGVTAVSIFDLGEAMSKLNKVEHASLASGFAYGRIDTLIGLNVLASADRHKRQTAMQNLSRLLAPKGVAYFTRPAAGAAFRKTARVSYFTDIEFKELLKGFFMNPETILSSNSKYPIIKCGGIPPL